MTQPRLSMGLKQKREVRTQFAALCYRRKDDKLQVMLVTTRRSGRWIVPKGWPMSGKTPAQAAAIEAWEEAGIEGRAEDRCLGIYSYKKELDNKSDLPVLALIYPLRVTRLRDDFPEADQRKRKWFSLKKAAKKVDDVELAKFLKALDPATLP